MEKQGVRGEVTAEQFKSIHNEIQQQIENRNTKYKGAADRHRQKLTFNICDYIWVILTKDHYSADDYNKLSERKIDRCEMLKRINDNAYQVKLPNHLKMTDIFNMKHLILYNGDLSEDEEFNSRTSSFQPWENDAAKLAIEFMEKHNSTKLSRRSR